MKHEDRMCRRQRPIPACTSPVTQLALVFVMLPLSRAGAERPLNNDEDLTRPLARLDLRYQFRETVHSLRLQGRYSN